MDVDNLYNPSLNLRQSNELKKLAADLGDKYPDSFVQAVYVAKGILEARLYVSMPKVIDEQWHFAVSAPTTEAEAMALKLFTADIAVKHPKILIFPITNS